MLQTCIVYTPSSSWLRSRPGVPQEICLFLSDNGPLRSNNTLDTYTFGYIFHCALLVGGPQLLDYVGLLSARVDYGFEIENHR